MDFNKNLKERILGKMISSASVAEKLTEYDNSENLRRALNNKPDYQYIEAIIYEEELRLKEMYYGITGDKIAQFEKNMPPSSRLKVPKNDNKTRTIDHETRIDGDLIADQGIKTLKRGNQDSHVLE